MGDAVQPVADGTTRFVKGMSLLPRSEKDLLQELLRSVAVAEDSHKQREDDMGVALVQCLKRGRLTSNNRGDQRVIRHIIWQQTDWLNWTPTLARSDDAQMRDVGRSLWRWLLGNLQLLLAVPTRAA
jgi:hypothetical protein